jgi:probable H4MPT-linked C1 transfer pathway protein
MRMSGRVLGLDIGGANLKAATNDGFALLRPFALWRRPDLLASELQAMLPGAGPFDSLAVTMTGELCDCFETKHQGVHHILDAVETISGDKPVRVWLTQQCFADLNDSRDRWLQVAAGNWLALAKWAGRFAPERGALLVDIGSTTTDIVALWNGCPIPNGLTDSQRLKTRELVYSGVRRTPVCSLVGDEIATELFATTLDVYLLLGLIPEDAADFNTADGRPATRNCARARLARMLGGDTEITSEMETLSLAGRVAQHQRIALYTAAQTVACFLPEPPRTVITSGSGEFLAEELRSFDSAWRRACVVSIEKQLGQSLSAAACAYAVAVLATEEGSKA